MRTFERARAEHRYYAAAEFAIKPLDKRAWELPPLKLDHLRHLTDSTGIFQHAVFTIPNYNEGYTTDDNVRALIVSVLLGELGHKESADLARRYLAFTWYAFNPETKRFRNFMDYQRNWLEESGSDDCHGRAWAFALLGIYEYLQRSDTGGHKKILEARLGGWWDANKIGLSPPLIETPEGWLMIYHGVKQNSSGSIYRLGLALFDLEKPEVCLKRSDEWIFAPEEPYELHGDVDKVVFPCGYTLAPDGDTLRIYYGAADTCIGMATSSLKVLLGQLKEKSDVNLLRRKTD